MPLEPTYRVVCGATREVVCRRPRLWRKAGVGSHPEHVNVTVHLPDELAVRLAAEAARRGVDIDQVAAAMVTAGLTEDHTGTAPAVVLRRYPAR